MVKILTAGGPMLWLILVASGMAIAVFVERVLHYHRVQINSMEFLNGVRNVLKRENVVEALSICDATPGPVARLVKIAILSRDRGRDGLRSALEEAGLTEVPPLEEQLNILATLAQIAPLMGWLGTTLGMVKVFTVIQVENLFANREILIGGIWQSLVCTAAGLALAIPCYAAYNYLVSRVNTIVLEMERAATEIINIVTDGIRTEP